MTANNRVLYWLLVGLIYLHLGEYIQLEIQVGLYTYGHEIKEIERMEDLAQGNVQCPHSAKIC